MTTPPNAPAEVDVLAAEVGALRLDAERWQMVRMLISVEAIDAEDSERADAGEWLAEEESVKSDAAIDLLREHVARASSDESDAARAEAGHG